MTRQMLIAPAAVGCANIGSTLPFQIPARVFCLPFGSRFLDALTMHVSV